jgi:hypothetical protein
MNIKTDKILLEPGAFDKEEIREVTWEKVLN